MQERDVRAEGPGRWIALGAAVLLATLAFSVLHAGGPHYRVQCTCGAVLTFEAPAMAHGSGGFSFVVPSFRAPIGRQEALPRYAGVHRLRPLRAPPAHLAV